MIDESYLLAEQLGQRLRVRGAKVTTAESCTGGGIAYALTAVPGSSLWFDCGFVTYSNEAKSRLLGVPEAILRAYGAVSGEVVGAMASGAARAASADFAVAVSGIAGPDGGSTTKPVGTVWFAWYHAAGLSTECRHFAGDRTAVREQAITVALQGLLMQLNTV